jgi:hypothetical protein
MVRRLHCWRAVSDFPIRGRIARWKVDLAERQPHRNRSATVELDNLSGAMLIVAAVAAILALVVYLLPALIAMSRGHQDTVAITALTILLGWSFIGWIVALVWSFSEVRRGGGAPAG